MLTDQAQGRRDQFSIISCLSSIGKDGDVFQACTDTMPSLERPSIHCPARNALPVMNLLQPDSCGYYYAFHLGSVLESNLRIGIKWFNQHATTPVRQSGTHESARVIDAQQSSFDTDAAG